MSDQDTNFDDTQKLESSRIAKSPNQETEDRTFKTKVTLVTDPSHPFSEFLYQAKLRGLKSIDYSDLIGKALSQISQSWWHDELEHMTPLEYKISAALSDPDMRKKLSILLSEQENLATSKTITSAKSSNGKKTPDLQ